MPDATHMFKIEDISAIFSPCDQHVNKYVLNITFLIILSEISAGISIISGVLKLAPFSCPGSYSSYLSAHNFS